YDMAMEMHDLQRFATDASNAFASLNRQTTEVATALGSRSDVPADVKTSFDAFNKDLTALAPKLGAQAGFGRGGGGGGGGRGGPNENVLAKIGQAKNGFSGGMLPAEPTTRAYNESKTQLPKAIADLNAAIAKASALGAQLAKYNLTLTAPLPVKAPEAAGTR